MINDIKHSGGYGWQWEFSANMSDDGAWSVTIVYIAPPGDQFKPKYSTCCPVEGFTDLPLASFTLTKIADLWQTECVFTKERIADDDDDGGGDSGDDPSYDFEPSDTKSTWEFTAGVVAKSIFAHPDFKQYFDNNENLRRGYEAIMSGRVDLDMLQQGKRLKRKDPYDKGLGNVTYDPILQQFFERIINKGYTDYYARSCSYSITTSANESNPDAQLSALISAAGGGFTKTGENNTTNGRDTEHSVSYSQIVEEGVIKI